MAILAFLTRRCLTLLVVVLMVGLGGVALTRLAPGFDVDEREMDPRYSMSSLEAVRAERAAERDVVGFYVSYLKGLARGDFGRSRSFDRPVAELLAERAPATAAIVARGLALAWVVGLGLAALAGLTRLPGADLAASVVAGASLCVPAALLAFAALYWNGPVAACIAAAVFPRIFRHTRNALVEARGRVHVMAAVARGVSPAAVMLRHVVAPVVSRTLALAGVSVGAALGAAVPVEVLADVPGIGQLAWKAASGRDLPLMAGLTLVVTAITMGANAVADAVIGEGGK